MEPLNMNSEEMQNLSRAVSAVDLNASLNAVKEQPDLCPRHSINPPISSIEHNSLNELKSAGVCSQDGISTPPCSLPPNPPPSTPAILEDTSNVNETNSTKLDADPGTLRVSKFLLGGEQEKKPKKKKSKSSKPKKPPVTGFEEFYADPPITPDTYTEELDLYDQSREFKDRMQSCIQRFRACRKLDQVRTNVFTKYLSLGGIETGQKQFTGGLDKETFENSTAQEITDMQATDYIRTNTQSSKFYDGSDNWVVDFAGVAKGFFSHRLPTTFPIESEKQLQSYCAVIRNFLNYILHHRVCPEYTADVLAARKIVDLAEKELWTIQKISSKAPGDYNVAASIIFGGRYTNVWGFGHWDDEKDSFLSQIKGFSRPMAEIIFDSAITMCASPEQRQRALGSEIFISKTERKFFEVVKIQRPTKFTVERYSRVIDPDGKLGRIKPLGILTLRCWKRTGILTEDLTDDENDMQDDESETESFWIEDDLLQLFHVSLRLELLVKELNIGIKFIDSFNGIYCSFYTMLPNEKMVGYKEPVPSNRPAPTEDDPEVGDRFAQDYDDED